MSRGQVYSLWVHCKNSHNLPRVWLEPLNTLAGSGIQSTRLSGTQQQKKRSDTAIQTVHIPLRYLSYACNKSLWLEVAIIWRTHAKPSTQNLSYSKYTHIILQLQEHREQVRNWVLEVTNVLERGCVLGRRNLNNTGRRRCVNAQEFSYSYKEWSQYPALHQNISHLY